MAVAHQVNAMLRSWLVTHIQNDDADYVPAVKQGWIAGRLKKLLE